MQQRRKQFVRKVLVVPEAFERYCADFNAGRFYEAHEHLEEVWQFERGPVRDFYKGLIQAAAACVHLSRGGYPGARRLLRTSARYLAPYRPGPVMGMEVEPLAAWLTFALETLETLGAAGIQQFPLDSRPVLAFDPAAQATEAQRWKAWGFDETGTALRMEVTVAA